MSGAKPFDIPKRVVWEAFKRVRANRGAAGVDKQSIADCLRSRASLAIFPNMPELRSMDTNRSARLSARARIIKALAHPTRLFIVEELAEGERCVCELTEMIGADTSTVSKHLSILKSVGILLDDKRGTHVFYQLRMPCVLDFVGCVESMMKQVAPEQLSLAC